ncbi:MAG: alkaline phosphatase PhoX [Nitrososphaeraceae archaeon]
MIKTYIAFCTTYIPISIGIVSLISIVFILDIYAQQNDNSTNLVNMTNLFSTKEKPHIQVISPANSFIKPIITSGDILPSGFTFPRIPDGIGVTENNNTGLIDIFVNHELMLDEVNEYAKISKISTTKNGKVFSGKLVEDGSGKYENFCSATLVKEEGFKNPIFLTNEEDDDGLVVAYDIVSGAKTEMPWLGLYSHENTIVVPNRYNKTVIVATEDGDYDKSQLYAFISNITDNFLRGQGQLYVLVGDNNISSFRDLQKGYQYQGHFEPVNWDWKKQNSTDLENEVQELNALNFIRLEDIDYDKNNKPIIYLADTGGIDEIDGDKYQNGRIYKFDLSKLLTYQNGNTNDRFNTTFSIILDGDEVGDDIRNPDNIATSDKSLMIQEDLNDYNKIDGGVNARILKYDLNSNTLTAVAIVDQSDSLTNSSLGGQWESTGIIETSGIFGPGTWLLDTQAHTLYEGGQLLLMRIDDS